MAETILRFDETTEGSDYHPLSAAAVGSLVLGLLSPLALIGPLLLVIPLLGIALALFSLRAIRQTEGAVTGAKTAYVGLGLCTVFAVALPTKTAFTRYLLAEAARPIAEAWFDFLRNDEPQKALQLTLPAAQRRELNDELWDYYSKSKEARDELEEFVASPVPRVLLEFGESCQVRFYEINRVETDASGDTIELVYAVTYPEKPTNEGGSPSGKRTFFVLSTIERRPLPSGEIGWRVVRNIGGFQPTSLME